LGEPIDAPILALLLRTAAHRESSEGEIFMVAKENKPKLTDAERHKRFVETATKVEASDDPGNFERAFKAVVKSSSPATRRTESKTGSHRNDP
jgi:hypothetical protein